MIITDIWESKTCSKPPSRYIYIYMCVCVCNNVHICADMISWYHSSAAQPSAHATWARSYCSHTQQRSRCWITPFFGMSDVLSLHILWATSSIHVIILLLRHRCRETTVAGVNQGRAGQMVIHHCGGIHFSRPVSRVLGIQIFSLSELKSIQ